MRAVVIDRFGDEDVMRIGDVPAPPMREHSLRIRVRATAVNRADLLQREGHYPPPPGASEIMGLECAGEVIEVGAPAASRPDSRLPGGDDAGFNVGDRVMALLPGGGYAEEVVAHAGSAMHVPDALTDIEAGALPEVFLTAFLNIFELARGKRGESVLLHGGGSGVGTAATTLCKLAGMRVLVTVGSADKVQRCIEHGADAAINYRDEEFEKRTLELTGGRGADIILDNIGARYLLRDLEALATDGRVVLIGSMGGTGKADIDVGMLLHKRQQIIGSTLRARAAESKAVIVAAFVKRFGDDLNAGRVKPVIDKVFPLEQIADAHRLMKASTHFGKIAIRF